MLLQNHKVPLPLQAVGDWNIYGADGRVAIPFDVFFSSGFSRENKVAENPVEQGGFVSYNKTASAYKKNVRLGKTGKPEKLAEYLEALENLVNGTELVSIVTPEKTYLDVNCVRFDYDRKQEDGVDRIIVDLTFQEIRQVEARYSNEQLPQRKVRNPQDSSTTDKGKQQGEEPRDSVLTKIGKAASV